MPEAQQLRRLVSERLSAAAEEICGLFEKAVAEYQEEIIQLKQRVEQLTVLKPHVLLLRADTQLEVLTSHQQSKEPNVEQNKACGPQQVKEEQVDVCIIPNLKSCPSEDLKVPLSESETTPQADFQVPPTLSTVTVTLSNDGEWIESSSGGGSRCGEKVKPDSRECRFCSKGFIKYCDLVRHMDEVHVGKKAFKCSQCDREFARRDHMVIHSRIHTGVKPYKCSFCGKSFAQTSNLNVHLRVHTGEKPYFCKSCGKMVAHSYHLKICAQTSGEKLFRCLVCGKKFHTVSDLKVHMPLHNARRSHTIHQSFT